MTRIFEAIFWSGLLWLAYVYVGYPALVGLISIFHTFRAKANSDYLPTVSVLLSARNEQKDIGWKIVETLGWDYPSEKLELLVASDASEDGTDEILKNIKDSRLRYLRLDQRQGKTEALNRLNRLAKSELLFFSDVNSHIEPDCLRRMVRHFADPKVGCVTGIERTTREGADSVVEVGSEASLGYEARVNSLESRIGSVLVCDGSIFCIRRCLFSPLSADLANDLELPVRIGAAGHAILFDSTALSFEKSTSSTTEEFRRKQRICGQGLLGMWRLRKCFKGLRAWQFFSRKFLRWLGAIPLALIFLSSACIISNSFYALAFVAQIAFYGLAIVGWWCSARSREGSFITTFPFYFVMVNIAALTGIVAAISGKRFSVWESAAHSRGAVTNSPPIHQTSPIEIASDGATLPASPKYTRELHPEKNRP